MDYRIPLLPNGEDSSSLGEVSEDIFQENTMCNAGQKVFYQN